MASEHEDFTAMFSSLGGAIGGFNPLMSVNLSGICATTKLLQCPYVRARPFRISET